MICNKNFRTLALSLLVCLYVHAQQDELQGFRGFTAPKPVHNQGILKFSAVPLFEGQIAYTGELRVIYERKIAKRQSITLSASYDFPNFILLAIGRSFGAGGRRGGRGGGRSAGLNSVSVEGGRIAVGYRYYPLKKQEGLKGFFVGPYLSYNAVNIRDKSNAQNYEIVNYADACGITGYQFIIKHFELEFFGGLGYKNNFVSHYNQTANAVNDQYTLKISALNNVKLVLQMNFGYAF